ncbi:hypothetical protein ANN_26604 [Periplaneta americana]|uniref:Uncharacterized protein n=1 Tax=Periplaneta americana TaxID=6978 RepID=A0ABQ8RYQ1_PERAM|nr:hypothetical protein ANN_26604 [Periplaneta americana]
MIGQFLCLILHMREVKWILLKEGADNVGSVNLSAKRMAHNTTRSIKKEDGKKYEYEKYEDHFISHEEETILRDTLLELEDRCEQYGMKINANKTKIMVIGRKIKKDLKQSIEQRDRKIGELKEKVDDLEQYQRRQCVRIFGIEEEVGENTDKLVVELAMNIGVELKVEDIDEATG